MKPGDKADQMNANKEDRRQPIDPALVEDTLGVLAMMRQFAYTHEQEKIDAITARLNEIKEGK